MYSKKLYSFLIERRGKRGRKREEEREREGGREGEGGEREKERRGGRVRSKRERREGERKRKYSFWKIIIRISSFSSTLLILF